MSAEAIKAKSALVEEIATKLKDAQSAVIVEYRGLSVAEVTELRRSLRAEDVEFKIYKNTLVRRATESTGYEELNAQLTGPNAIAFGHSDAVAPARVLAKFAKDHEALVIKAGMVEGKVLDVVVDVRKNSKTFGKTFSIELTAENKKQLLIPRGFLHGFAVLSDIAVFTYKCDNFYCKEAEFGVRYNDPDLNIDWQIPEDKIIASEKDKTSHFFKELL